MKVAFLVNGAEDSAMGERARAFATRLDRRWDVQVAYRGGRRTADITVFARWLAQVEPEVVYVFDMAVAGVVAGAWQRTRRKGRLVIDTGDAITALVRSSGLRGPLGLLATSLLERFSLRVADHIVVRGSFHRELLARQGIETTLIPDGVDLGVFTPGVGGARQELGLGDQLVVGLVGSSVWSPSLKIAYGWDLVELLALVPDLPIRGLLVGDGSGIAHLRQRARALGVEDRMVFAGRRPLADLPRLLAACDVCLSTQTNDIAGNVRTTGKLPLYLACGRYVLASQVGEAARVLPAEMLVPYEGTVDLAYPARLAERVRGLALDRTRLARGLAGVELARTHFDYDLLARRVETVLAGRGTTAPAGAPSSLTAR